MPALRNPQHEQFCHHVVDGMNSSEAHKACGYDGGPQAASKIRKRPEVVARIAELTAQRAKIAERAAEKSLERAAHKHSLSKDYVIDRLMTIVERSLQHEPVKGQEGVYKFDANAANKALQLLGQHLGLYVTRTEVGAAGDFIELDSHSLKNAIAERLAIAHQKANSDTAH